MNAQFRHSLMRHPLHSLLLAGLLACLLTSSALAKSAPSDYSEKSNLAANIWLTREDEMVNSLRTDTQYILHIRIDTTEAISGARLALFDDLLGGLIITDRECNHSQQLICCLTATDQETMCSMSKFSAQDDEKLILLYIPGSARLHTPGPDGGSSKIADQDLFNDRVGAYLAGTNNPDDQLPIGRNAAEITLSVNTIDYNGPLEDISDTRYDRQSDTVLITQSALADNSEPSNPVSLQNLWLIILNFIFLAILCVGIFYLRRIYKTLNDKE